MKMLDVPQSGSIAGVTSSRNRYGQYKRTRAIPVNRNTTFQSAVRTRLALLSAGFSLLTAAQRAGWSDLGASYHRSDSLGQVYDLTGAQAYCALNSENLAAGDAILSDAPAVLSVPGLATAVLTTAGGTLSLAYTATPLAASTRLFVYMSPQKSAGVTFNADYRLVSVTAAAAASPTNLLAAYTARFGAPVVGNKIFASLQTFKGGFKSGPLNISVIVTA